MEYPAQREPSQATNWPLQDQTRQVHLRPLAAVAASTSPVRAGGYQAEHEVGDLLDTAITNGSAFGVEAEVLVEVELSGARLAVHLQPDCDLERGPVCTTRSAFTVTAPTLSRSSTPTAPVRDAVVNRSRELRRFGQAATVAHSRRATCEEFASSEPSQSAQGPERIVPCPLLTRGDDQRDLAGGAGEVGGDDVGGVAVEGDSSALVAHGGAWSACEAASCTSRRGRRRRGRR